MKDYFSFSRTEFRIILVLSFVLLLVTLIRIYTDSQIPVLYVPTKEELQRVEDFIASLEKTDREKKERTKIPEKEYYYNLRLFNPDKVLVEELKEMGFPENVISNISAYRKAGGHFRKPEELRKIYGISDSSFTKILPFINIPDTIKSRTEMFKARTVSWERINLNTADSSELISLNGIGPVFASRIIKYRNKLGGFFSPEQLLEVYGMDSLKYQLIKYRLYADTLNIRKMDINNLSLSSLSKHPYIDQQTAASIIKFRDFKGKITDINDLIEYRIVQKDRLKKIEPYLNLIP